MSKHVFNHGQGYNLSNCPVGIIKWTLLSGFAQMIIVVGKKHGLGEGSQSDYATE